MFSTIRKYAALKNYQYEVTTGLYMLEPWEKALFIGLTLLIYTTIFVLPDQLSQIAVKLADYTPAYY
ncbi:12563_t:CDS:2 [Ambispora gerdemannii]|uniref:12563_t:CDS:1 n=1 Tax=Ambispora gerdemannii TaxID=144530 RepID=A0A9N9FCZ1_9GLOM|nr:12563_t:CDS:2 [Ambispora gerdemannii]